CATDLSGSFNFDFW
nr:immunoglobulin heavy chain junction region [Macaca mulatta]MOV38976.1 immunoglobulin heavy chain junction region [Macaca mulatta]MOV39932.1 immunoglobulin heavy chain junction region [Macaca mulatta]MOV40276.1 immunoglobulin heavy chain junction region [Macaca mulatta]MOV43304.1 immunoglobulin heavy chain junction region [Macaca mulatta]